MKAEYSIVMFILLAVTALGQPFVQESYQDDTLQVVASLPLVFKTGANFSTGNVHVFYSNGTVARSDVTTNNCTIHIYDDENQVSLSSNLGQGSDGIVYTIPLNESFFETEGEYGLVIWCWTETEHGFFAGEFAVNEYGTTNEFQKAKSGLVLNYLILYVISILLLYVTVWNQGYKFVASAFMFAATLIFSQYYENILVSLIIYVSAVVFIIQALNALAKAGREM